MNKSIEEHEVEYWDGEFAGPFYDEQEGTVQPKRRPPKTKLQQMDLELEYDIDEI